MTQKPLKPYVRALARQIWSPGLFARIASEGRWKMAPHLKILDRALTKLARGRQSRLIVQMPPRHGKSELLGRYLPAWYLGMFPNRQVIYSCYGATLARSFGLSAREVFEQWGRSAFGLQLSRGARAAGRWRIAQHEGGMHAISARGPLTGKGANLLIIDDPIKSNEDVDCVEKRVAMWDWFHSTAMTRLEPGGAVIVNMTRWHEDDLIGRLLKGPGAERWKVLRFPAICEEPDELGRAVGDALWPGRFPLEDTLTEWGEVEGLLTRRATMPERWWEAMYQQNPQASRKHLWKEEYFQGDDLWFQHWPADDALRVMTLDPAFGQNRERGDYSAYVMLSVTRAGQIFVEADLQRGNPLLEVIQTGMEHLKMFRPHAFKIETNMWQELLRSDFETALRDAGLMQYTPGGIENRQPKTLRIEQLEGMLRARMIRFRDTAGTRLLVDQLRDFPSGEHDDGPDALEMAARTAKEICAEENIEMQSGIYFRGAY